MRAKACCRRSRVSGSSAPNGSSSSISSGSRGERAREPDALLLAARELVRPALAELRRARARRARAARRRARGCARASQPSSSGVIADVLGDRQVREQPDLLEAVADAPPQLGPGQLARVVAVDAARCRSEGSISRFTILSVVVLPEPEPPHSTSSSPSATRRSRSARPRRARRSACVSPLELDHARGRTQSFAYLSRT